MANKNKKTGRIPLEIIALVFLFFAIIFFRGGGQIAWSDAGDPGGDVRGYAWSSNYGWISFNCLNDNSCGTVNYSVKIQDQAAGFNLIGHAWSPNAGWISFERDAGAPNPPDNYKFNANCFTSNCTSGNNCLACYNRDNGNIYGWARVLSFGNDGWISLGTSTAPFPFQVSIDQTTASATFRGWGWNGNTDKYKGLGWVSFNCADLGVCATANYFTYFAASHLPVAQNLKAPNWSYANACPAAGAAAGVALNSFLTWDFYDQDCGGNCQTAFQVIVNTANSTTTPPPLINTGKKGLSVTQYNASNTSGLLGYDALYYWWVRVWDNFGFVSKWVQFDTSKGGTLTDNQARNISKPGNNATFITYRHEFPEPKFVYAPLKPLAYYPVTSTLAGFYYNSAAPSTRAACDKTHCSSTWGGVRVVSNSATTSSSTVMTFKYGGGAKINLKLEDIGQAADDNYYCVSSSPSFFVDTLPVWIEKKAQ